MRTCAPAISAFSLLSRGNRLPVHLTLAALLILLPISTFAQEEKAAEKVAAQQARQEAAAKQQT